MSAGPASATPPALEPAEPRAAAPPAYVVKGATSTVSNDLYYFLLKAGWGQMVGLVFAAFVVINTIFAGAYLMSGGVKGAQPGSFSDAFFFSVQTLATIGYGAMYPDSMGSHVLVSIEAIVGLLSTAMITGLAFAKFSRPRARILFTKHAVIAVRDGEPTLMVRVANERRNYVADAQMKLSLLRLEHTLEGEEIRRIIDLPMVRSNTPAFTLTWTGMHKVTPESPLHNATPETLKAGEVQLIVTVIGHDETFGSTIHARHSYPSHSILWNRRFADVFHATPEGVRVLDFTVFHDTEEMPDNARVR